MPTKRSKRPPETLPPTPNGKCPPDRMRLFAMHYVQSGFRGAEAAKKCGYSDRHAVERAKWLLDHRFVQAEIAKLREALTRKMAIGTHRIMSELATQAFYDAGEIANFNISGPADIARLPEPLRRAVIGWRWDGRGHFVLKLAEKVPALELLGRCYGLWKGGTPDLPDEDEQSAATQVVDVDLEQRRAAIRREFHELLMIEARQHAKQTEGEG